MTYVQRMLHNPVFRRLLALAAGMLRLAGEVAADVAEQLGSAERRFWRTRLRDLAAGERGLSLQRRALEAELTARRHLKLLSGRPPLGDSRTDSELRAA